jgi:hypothetical protein
MPQPALLDFPRVPAQHLVQRGLRGELEIVARFPDGEVRISNFEELDGTGKTN